MDPDEPAQDGPPENGNGSGLAERVDEASARATLDHILASEAFANAGRLSRFLRFTVEQTLAGRGAGLKEYVLGVEVFDRSDAFDPRTDSIVRVEARRLRAKLAEYYEQEGAADPLVVRLRKGSYVPRFERRDGPRPPGAPEPRSAPDVGEIATTASPPGGAPAPGGWGPGRHAPSRTWGVAAAVAAVLLVAALGWRWASGVSAPAPVTIAVLPVVNHSGDARQDALADRLTDAIISELARIPSLGVRSRTSVMQYREARRPLREIARALDASVILEASLVEEGTTVTVAARLVRAQSDTKFWVDDFTGPADDLPDLARRVAAGVAAAVTRPSQRR